MSANTVQKPAMAAPSIETSFLILFDTHGLSLAGRRPHITTDVVIYCGDLTEGSQLHEYRTTIGLLRSLKAPLKLVIPGNHDVSFDEDAFRRRMEDARSEGIEPELLDKDFGQFGDAKQLFLDARDDGIFLLDEGQHEFDLANGAKLRVYASPYTPLFGEWAFQYYDSQGPQFRHRARDACRHDAWAATRRARSRDAQLFGADARTRPLMHCFRHIHAGWGAKMVTWRDQLSERPSHMAGIDQEKSKILEQVSTLQRGKYDSAEDAAEKERKLKRLVEQKYCKRDGANPPTVGKQTLFVNAAIKVHDGVDPRLP
jgi:3',5'-cyclic AMP phosphodiesterase CpdA